GGWLIAIQRHGRRRTRQEHVARHELEARIRRRQRERSRICPDECCLLRRYLERSDPRQRERHQAKVVLADAREAGLMPARALEREEIERLVLLDGAAQSEPILRARVGRIANG